MIYGVFGHTGSFWAQGFCLGDLGINAFFVGSGDIDQPTIERIRAEGGRIFAEFATLNGDCGDCVANHAEAHPIDPIYRCRVSFRAGTTVQTRLPTKIRHLSSALPLQRPSYSPYARTLRPLCEPHKFAAASERLQRQRPFVLAWHNA